MEPRIVPLAAADILLRRDPALEDAYSESLFDPARRGVRIDRYGDHAVIYLSCDVPHKQVHEYRLTEA